MHDERGRSIPAWRALGEATSMVLEESSKPYVVLLVIIHYYQFSCDVYICIGSELFYLDIVYALFEILVE